VKIVPVQKSKVKKCIRKYKKIGKQRKNAKFNIPVCPCRKCVKGKKLYFLKYNFLNLKKN
jgi:hypothetical protein